MMNLDLKLMSDNVEEMGMFQLVHNQFFVKDGCAWYRDFDREISARDLVREIVKKNSEVLVVDEAFFTDDDFFDEEMCEWLQYSTDDFYGVIGMYYTAMWGMADIREWYKESLHSHKGMTTGLYDKTGQEIKIGDKTKLVLEDGEERIFDVCFKTVTRSVKCHPDFEDEYSKVNVTGIVFCWNGYDLFPCVNENNESDISKMEII